MTSRTAYITGITLFAVAGFLSFVLSRDDDKAGKSAVRSLQPQAFQSSVPVRASKSQPPIAQSPFSVAPSVSLSSTKSAYRFSVRVDPADTIDFDALRHEVLLDIQYGKISQPLRREFWDGLDKQSYLKRGSEFLKTPEYLASAIQAQELDSEYQVTTDLARKAELIELKRGLRAKAEGAMNAFITRTKAEISSLAPPVPTVGGISSEQESASTGAGSTGLAPLPPPKSFH